LPESASNSPDVIPAQPSHLQTELQRIKDENNGVSETALAGAMGNEPYTLDKPKEDISDVVKIDDEGRGHDPSGRFLSDKNLDTIRSNADQIREGEEEWNRLKSEANQSENNENTDDQGQEGAPKDIESGYQKIGEAVSKRIDELKSEGMSDRDALAKAHDEFWDRVENASANQPGPDEGSDKNVSFPPEDEVEGVPFYVKGEEKNGGKNDAFPPEDEVEGVPFYIKDQEKNNTEGKKDAFPPEDEVEGVPFFIKGKEEPPKDGPPEENPPVEKPPVENGPEEAERVAEAALAASIVSFAAARIQKEKIFGGGKQEQAQFDTAEAQLQQTFHEFLDRAAEKEAAEAEKIKESIEQLKAKQAQIAENVTKLRSALEDPDLSQAEIVHYTQQLEQNESEYANIGKEILAASQELSNIEQRMQESAVEMVASIRNRVDAEMVEQREKAHPRLAKVNNWLKKHKGARFVAGVAFSAMAITGTITGIVPIAAVGIAGRSMLGAFGGYNAVRAAGDFIGGKQLDRSDLTTIEGYTTGAEKESNTVRRSKKGGAVAGTVLGALPVLRGISHAPAPTPPKTHSAEEFWYKGLSTSRPTASADFSNQMSAVTNGELIPSPQVTAALENMKIAREAVIGKLTEPQGRNLDLVLGRLSTTPGIGNEGSANMMNSLAGMLKQGLNANDIISRLGAGPADIDLSVVNS